nr:T9SS type A sorting domain-containing protein [uncultured Dyadobacter sp.]
MKTLYLFLLLGALAETTLAQNSKYSYDSAGNRNKRIFEPALPVTLVDFSAIKLENSVLLTWATSFETNASHFELQRSGNGTQWGMIGKVDAAGESSSENTYSFPDLNPLPGENLYRLKMVDYDETFKFSRIRSVSFEPQVAIFPNPVRDRLIISSQQTQSVQILNAAGQTVFKTNAIPLGGIDVSGLATGIYLVLINLPGGFMKTATIIKE